MIFALCMLILSPLFRHRQIRFTVLKLPKVQAGGRFPTIHVRFLVDQRGGHIDAMFSGIQFVKKYVIRNSNHLFCAVVYVCFLLFYTYSLDTIALSNFIAVNDSIKCDCFSRRPRGPQLFVGPSMYHQERCICYILMRLF